MTRRFQPPGRGNVAAAVALAAVLCSPGPASAQEAPAGAARVARVLPAVGARYVHDAFTVEDGLPVNSVNALLQSRDGYVWAATFDGLVRFDGVRFTVFHSGNTAGLPSNRIIDLREARDSSLWVLTEQHQLVRFRRGSFTHFGADRGVNGRVHAFVEDSAGVIWLSTETGLFRIRGDAAGRIAPDMIRTGRGTPIAARDSGVWYVTAAGTYRVRGDSAAPLRAPGLETEIVWRVHEDAGGTLWLAAANGLYRWPAGSPRALRVAPIREILDMHSASAEPGAPLWVIANQGIWRVHGDSVAHVDRSYRLVQRPGMVQSDAAGSVWYATGTELHRDGRLVHPQPPFNASPRHTITGFLLDAEGSIWIGTTADGLHRLKSAAFTNVPMPRGVGAGTLYTTYEDRAGNVWLGSSETGLARVSGDSATAFHYDLGRGLPSMVATILEDRSGAFLWVGTMQSGLLRCSLPEPTCRSVNGAPTGSTVFALHQEEDGRLWVGTDSALFQIDGQRWTRLSAAAGAPARPVRGFQRTRDGALWMATNGSGIARYADGAFEHVREADGLPSDLVRALYEDADGYLWVGTEGRGLARLHAASWHRGRPAGQRRIDVFRARHGLFDEVIHQILEDDFGRLWMSTNRGIFWVSRNELNAFADGRTARIHSTAYTERDGLLNREANGGMQPAGVRTRDGRLWFATQAGAAVVDPARIGRNPVPPPVVIETVTAGQQTVLAVDTVRLARDERDLEIGYTALSFVAPENVRFRYRLDPYDADWVDAGARRTAFYTRVPPGDYTFRVIARNEAGVWNETGAAVALLLPPRFTETAAWRVLLMLAVLLTGGLAILWRDARLRARAALLEQRVAERTVQLRERERQLLLQADQLKELDRAKTNFFANISHEFRTPLTLTLGPLEDLRDRWRDARSADVPQQLDMALRNARRLLRLVNQILDVARLEAGRMPLRAREGDVVSFVRAIASAFAALAESRGIALDVAAEPDVLPVWFDPDALEKVVTNLLSNAFKFTGAGGRIAITIRREERHGAGTAVIRFADDGPGIAPESLPHIFDRFYRADESHTRTQVGTGIGLSLTKELVELHGGTITADSSGGTGAAFTITLRLGRAHLRPDQLDDGVRQGQLPDATPDGAVGDAGSPATSPPDAPEDGSDVPTILVVDDSEDLRAYVRARLERRYRVVEAEDGAAALTLARELVPDLIVSDVAMPRMDGEALCRALRADPETDFIPIVLLTARATLDHRISGLEEGADDYIAKPFEARELEARVANLIESRGRLRERYAGAPLQLTPRGVATSSADEAFIERVRTAIEANLTNADFGVAELAAAVFQDRSHLFRRTRDLFGESPSDLIRRLRIEYAARLLDAEEGSIADVAYGAGFNSVSYFCRRFRDRFGVTPAAYRTSGVTRD